LSNKTIMMGGKPVYWSFQKAIDGKNPSRSWKVTAIFVKACNSMKFLQSWDSDIQKKNLKKQQITCFHKNCCNFLISGWIFTIDSFLERSIDRLSSHHNGFVGQSIAAPSTFVQKKLIFKMGPRASKSGLPRKKIIGN